eukprot:TRINITY_DN13330_c0_g1_i1.p5 TRINITY_DN13330_c0_g1~~TRINITY_DN13330_c0_g1_i1.p5  ORF type:complete len:51 (+),score=5.37 TRINITY_DN13330_c0_g1_i1:186-338(+)
MVLITYCPSLENQKSCPLLPAPTFPPAIPPPPSFVYTSDGKYSSSLSPNE